MISAQQLVEEMLRRSLQLDEAIVELQERSYEWAVKYHRYKHAYAAAYLETEGRVDERKARTILKTNKARQDAYMAEGVKVAALESVRSRRVQLSAAQSVAGAFKAEAELARTGPGI